MKTKSVIYVDPRKTIVRDNFNPRIKPDVSDLLPSIKANGVHDAVDAVKQVDGTYLLNAQGHRRRLAVLELIESGVTKTDSGEPLLFPVIEVEESGDLNQHRIEIVTLNTGKPLTMLEEARVYADIIGEVDHEENKEEWVKIVKDIASKVGKTYNAVSNLINLLDATKVTQKLIDSGKISASLVLEMWLNGKAKGNWEKVEDLATEAVAAAAAKGKDKATKKDVKKEDEEVKETKAERESREKAEKEAEEEAAKDKALKIAMKDSRKRVMRLADFAQPFTKVEDKGFLRAAADFVVITSAYLYPDAAGNKEAGIEPIDGFENLKEIGFGDINANYKKLVREHNAEVKAAVDAKSEELKKEIEELKAQLKAQKDSVKAALKA